MSLRATPLTSSRSLLGQLGIRLRQQVEDGELRLGESLARRALLVLGEVPRERLQPTQHLVDVQAAGVVVRRSASAASRRGRAGMGCAARCFHLVADLLGKPLRRRTLPAGETGR